MNNRDQSMTGSWSFEFRILVKKVDDLWVAHCLELDLVAASPCEKDVQDDIIAVIMEQVRYCILNDNMDHLFRRAPKEIWDEYFSCEKPAGRLVNARLEEASPESPQLSFTANACTLSDCRALETSESR
jgi:hypothetical protein